MPSCTLSCIYAVLSTLGSPAGPGASDNHAVGDIALYGNERILWVCQQRPQTDGARLLRFAYRKPGGREQGAQPSAATPFLALPVEPLVGRIALATVRGDDLHIFFEDGSHHRFAPPGVPSSRTPGRVRTVELILPDGSLPRAIAADQVGNRLFALVTARQAERIPTDPDTEPGDNTAPTEDRPTPADDQGPIEPSETSATEEGPTSKEPDLERALDAAPVEPPTTDFALVRYAGGRWEWDRDAPEELTVEGAVHALLARDGVVHVVYLPTGGTSAPVHRFSTAPEEPWSEAIALPVPAKDTPLAAAWVDEHPVLLYGGDEAAGITIHPLLLIDDEWEPAPRLRDESNHRVIMSDAWGVTIFDGSVTVARLDDESAVQIGRWSLGDGMQIGPLVQMDAFARERQVRVNRLLRNIVPWVVLTALLGFVFVWRRDSVVHTIPLESGWTIARLQHRAGALFIDITVTSPLWAPAVFALWRTGAPELPVVEQITATGGQAPPVMIWSPAIVGAVLAVYATIFELAVGATPGKRITGCSVVDQDGQRCGIGAILIRNVVRIIEFHFAAVAILVLLTPNRQRLGDILARTVVVQAAPAPPPTPQGSDRDEGA